jgi:hypothetical protein
VALGIAVACCAGTEAVGSQFLKREHVDLTDLRETFFSVTCVAASVKYWTWWCIVTDNKWCTFTAVWHRHELVRCCYLPVPCKYSLRERGTYATLWGSWHWEKCDQVHSVWTHPPALYVVRDTLSFWNNFSYQPSGQFQSAPVASYRLVCSHQNTWGQIAVRA